LAVSLNGKEAIVDALRRHAEAFGDRPDFWTEANILNPDFRALLNENRIVYKTNRDCNYFRTKQITKQKIFN